MKYKKTLASFIFIVLVGFLSATVLSGRIPTRLPNVEFTEDMYFWEQIYAYKEVRFYDSNQSKYIGLTGPSTVSSSVTFTLPAADGTASQFLITDGSGTWSFSSSMVAETIKLYDSDKSNTLEFSWDENDSSDRTLKFKVNSGNRVIDLSGNLTLTGNNKVTSWTVGNTGLTVGSSVPFSDSSGVLTLQNIDAIDSTTESTIETAIDTLPNLTSIQAQTVTLGGSFITTGNNQVASWAATTSVTTPSVLSSGSTFLLQDDGNQDIHVFGASETGEYPSFVIYGYKTGAGLRSIQFRMDQYGSAYIESQEGLFLEAGTSALNLQTDAAVDVKVFDSSSEGETKEFTIAGYKTGDAKRSLEIGIGVDADDTASFDGVSNYYFDGNVGISGNLSRGFTATENNTDSDQTYTAAQLFGGLIRRGTGDELTAARADSTDTAANIVATIPNCQVGSGFVFYVNNEDSTHAITLAGGAGVTVSPNDPSNNIPANSSAVFLLIVTNATASSEAVTIHCLGITAH